MNRVVLVLMCLAFCVQSFAKLSNGKPQLDSLFAQQSKFVKDDSERVKYLVSVASNYKYFKPDSGIIFGEKALEISGKINWEQGFALANNVIGQNYQIKSEIDRALGYYIAARGVNRKLNNLKDEAKNLANIGSMYGAKSIYDSAVNFLNLALEINKSLNNQEGIANDYASLALVFNKTGNNVKALDYNFKALNLFYELKDSLRIGNTLVNIGIIYKSQRQHGKALEVYRQALQLNRKTGDANTVAACLSNIGSVFKAQKIYDSALFYYQEALSGALAIGAKNYITINYCNLADVYSLIKKYETANRLYDTALILNRQYNFKKSEGFCLLGLGQSFMLQALDSNFYGNRNQLLKKAKDTLNIAAKVIASVHDFSSLPLLYKDLSRVDSTLGDMTASLKDFQQAVYWEDSTQSMNNRLAISKLEASHELELKDKDITLEKLRKANNQKLYIIYIAGIVFLLFLLVWLVRKFAQQIKSNRHLKEEKEKHLEHIKAQSDVLADIAFIQSHEIRGPVTTLMGLASLFNLEDPADPVNKELMEGVISVSERLDDVIIKVVDKENSLQKNNPSAGHNK